MAVGLPNSRNTMAGSDEHLKPLRLFNLARDGGLETTDEERSHLQDCEECQHVIAVFSRQCAILASQLNNKPEDAA